VAQVGAAVEWLAVGQRGNYVAARNLTNGMFFGIALFFANYANSKASLNRLSASAPPPGVDGQNDAE
jgi:hypothetical protein